MRPSALIMIGLPLLVGACGSDEMQLLIATPWNYMSAQQLAPPALADQDRVIVASSGTQGEIISLGQTNGRTVDPAFDAFPTSFAPVALAGRIYIVTTVGRVTAFDAAGNTMATSEETYGRTGPLVASRQGLALGTTDGRLVQFDTDLNVLSTAMVTGAVTTAPAITSDGSVYVAADTGRVTGVDPDGMIEFSESVLVPASGPSVSADGLVAVGDGSGVSVFTRGGTLEFRIERPARVVGTKFIADGSLLAWGEDGFVERYDSTGEILMSFNGGPPIETEVVDLPNGMFGVVNRDGTATLVDEMGMMVDTMDFNGRPEPQIAVREGGLTYYSFGATIQAISFAFVP